MKWHVVDSSTVRAVAYDGKKKEMWIRFGSGSTYRYFEVPIQIMGAFMRSRSKGRAHHRLIKGRHFAYERVDISSRRRPQSAPSGS